MSKVSSLLFSLFFLTGCVYRVTDIPTVSFTPIVQSQKVYIYTSDDPYSWHKVSYLAADLQAAGFSPIIISNIDDAPDSAYVIDQIESSGKCFSEPLFFVLTLGIIPHIGCEEFGHNFELYRKGSSYRTNVNAKYTVKVMAGWLVWPAAFSSSYVFTSSTPDVELRGNTAIMLLKKELNHALQ